MKKILIIHHGKGLGGGLVALLALINELKSKFDVSVISIHSSSADSYIKETGVNFKALDSFFYKYIYRFLSYSEAEYYSCFLYIYKFYVYLVVLLNKYFFSKKILNNIKSEKYELVYLNSTFLSEWAFYARKNNIPVIMHVREPLKRDKSIFCKFILTNINKYVNQTIAISNDNARRINTERKKISVIYDPVLSENRNNIDIRSSFKSEFIYVIYVGGISRIKGIEQLLKSLKYINSNIKVLALGNYEINKSIKRTIMSYVFRGGYVWREKKIQKMFLNSNNIIHIGLCDNVLDYMSFSKALISPFSKPHASLPILEAMSIGLPVISSNVSGSEELIDHNNNGYLFQNGNEKDLAFYINKLAMLTASDYNKLSNAAKVKYKDIVMKSNETSVVDHINIILK